MKQEHVLSCQVARYLRIRGYITVDCDVMSALKYLPVRDDRNRAMFVKSRKDMGYTLGQADLVVINKYGDVSFLELKNGKAGKQSDNQKYFEEEVKCRGGKYELIRTIDDVVEFVNRDLSRNTAKIPEQVRYDSIEDFGVKCSNNGAGAILRTSDRPAIRSK